MKYVFGGALLVLGAVGAVGLYALLTMAGVFPRYDGSGRPRTYVSGHNPRGRSNDNAQRKAANDDGC